MKKHSIAIHGGAGTLLKSNITAEQEKAFKNALTEALVAGDKVLAQGGKALDAVAAAIVSMEDCPLFNAGRGSVFTHEGKNEMDASLMCGETLMAGAVAGVKNIKNPIVLAQTVMQQSEHVLLCGEGAMKFAQQKGITTMPDDYFFSDWRWEQLQSIRDTDGMILDHTVMENGEKKFGTVGAVALDIHGNIAAGTSTGGMTNKRWGRAGDSPVIGAGTYANNNTCAVSCTGHGEFFIRAVVAYDISCLMEYKGLSLAEACKEVVNNKLVKLGGEGGLIAIDKNGNICMPFNSEGMYRGYQRIGEAPVLGIYND